MSGIACMVSGCRKELALVKATDKVAKYECKACGTAQYCFDRDGVEIWRKSAHYSFNSWVHGTVPS